MHIKFIISKIRALHFAKKHSWHPSRLTTAGTSALLALAGAAHAESVSVLINPGDQGAKAPTAALLLWKSTLEEAVHQAKLPNVEIKLSTDASADLATTRAQTYDIYVAPAHVVGSAVRYGYTPLVGVNHRQRVVLAALSSHPVAGLAGAKGQRLGLPQQDSLVTYLMRGELNAANTTPKQHFSDLYETRYQDALLLCLKMQRCDVVAVEQTLFEEWQHAGEPVASVMQSKETPGLAVAVKPNSKIKPEILKAALEKAWAAKAPKGSPALVPLQAQDFAYVSTLGYFTPNHLPGATVVSTAEVSRLLEGGALYVDTRNQAEFDAGHVPGAKLVPYHEKSAKSVDFDPTHDSFDVKALPAPHNSALIFGCNGPECWKSYKASLAAQKAGYTRIYWFRDGFPGWRSAGQRVATGG